MLDVVGVIGVEGGGKEPDSVGDGERLLLFGVLWGL
jgi:hypothetical protein